MEPRTAHSPQSLSVQDHALGGVWFPVSFASVVGGGAWLTVRIYGPWAQQRADLTPVARSSRVTARRSALTLVRLLREATNKRDHNRIARNWHAEQLARRSNANLD